MAADRATTFSILKTILKKYSRQLRVKTDTPTEYVLTANSASPFPQHKGQPLDFAYLRIGKNYVSIHLLALYLSSTPISPELKKRMQGKTCFNFTAPPPPELLSELRHLTETGYTRWKESNWL